MISIEIELKYRILLHLICIKKKAGISKLDFKISYIVNNLCFSFSIAKLICLPKLDRVFSVRYSNQGKTFEAPICALNTDWSSQQSEEELFYLF